MLSPPMKVASAHFAFLLAMCFGTRLATSSWADFALLQRSSFSSRGGLQCGAKHPVFLPSPVMVMPLQMSSTKAKVERVSILFETWHPCTLPTPYPSTSTQTRPATRSTSPYRLPESIAPPTLSPDSDIRTSAEKLSLHVTFGQTN